MSIINTMNLCEKTEKLVEWLALYGKSNDDGVTRLLYTSEWIQAQQALKQKMEEFGLDTYFDDVGNLFGRLSNGQENESIILTGSHVDTVINGGKYDGAFGIIASLIAVDYLKNHYGKPKKSIEVVSLCEEEGSRFPMTFWGSGSMAGKRFLKDVESIKDIEQIPFVQAMNDAGFGQGTYKNPIRNDIDCFIELHIEQGIVLEREQKSIGIVSHIVGQRRFEIIVKGESNHAGTTPMPYRKDAMYIASLLIQTLIQKAIATDPELVATVGQISLEPNVPNVIANKATFTIDIRHSQEEVLDQFSEQVFNKFQEITDQHEAALSINKWMDVKPVKMDENLMNLAQSIVEKNNISYKKMTSGAGHDSQIFGTYCPTALLFVPSHNGISHSPYEFTKTEDLEKGIQVLINVLYELAY